MATTKEQAKEQALRAGWTRVGLAANVQDDLVALADELAFVTGNPPESALGVIEAEVRERMETAIMDRIADTLTYNGDLKRSQGGGKA